MSSKLETSVNLAIIMLCLVVASVLVNKHFFPATEGPYVGIEKGEVLELPDAAILDETESTLVIALSSKCRFCTESFPFYKSLVERRTRAGAGLKIVAVVNGTEDVAAERRLLGEAEMEFDHLAAVDFRSLKIPSTPTLLLVDRHGKLLELWKGRLDAEGESEVLRVLDLA